jgi:GDP-fucose protein O-fucosyltransferase
MAVSMHSSAFFRGSLRALRRFTAACLQRFRAWGSASPASPRKLPWVGLLCLLFVLWQSAYGVKHLYFEVCNGYTNQRIALVNGLVLSQLLERNVHMPVMQLYGEQRALYNYAVNKSMMSATSLVTFFGATTKDNVNALLGASHRSRGASSRAFRVLPRRRPPWYARRLPSFHGLSVHEWERASRRLSWYMHVSLPCVFDATKYSAAESQLFWNMNNALVHSDAIASFADYLVAQMMSACGVESQRKKFSFLHLRVEPEFEEHCKVWEAQTGLANCFPTSSQILEVVNRLPTDLPLYIAADLHDNQLFSTDVVRTLQGKYCIATKEQLMPAFYDLVPERQRELRAAIEYEVATRATIFVGNSVSTFSALQIMGRNDPQAGYAYNAGQVPLASMIPAPTIKRLKWVFAFVSTGFNSSVGQDIRVAVVSAMRNTRFEMVAIVYGHRNALTDWLNARGVNVIFHAPLWLKDVIKLMDRSKAAVFSPNYGSFERLIATYLRLDISTLLKDDEYALYTDTDVVFLRDIPLARMTLPEFLSIGPESEQTGGAENMGVLLMNLKSLRRTYKKLLQSAFHTPELYRSNEYGPLDQGAFKHAYRGQIGKLHAEMNWKPYWPSSDSIAILHFHGPKRQDYEKFFRYKTTTRLYNGIMSRCSLDGACGEACAMYDAFLAEAA